MTILRKCLPICSTQLSAQAGNFLRTHCRRNLKVWHSVAGRSSQVQVPSHSLALPTSVACSRDRWFVQVYDCTHALLSAQHR